MDSLEEVVRQIKPTAIIGRFTDFNKITIMIYYILYMLRIKHGDLALLPETISYRNYEIVHVHEVLGQHYRGVC